MKLSRLIVMGLATCVIAASSAQGKIYHQIDLPQYQGLHMGQWIDNVCATSTSTRINVNHLRWTLRRRDSHLRLMPGTPANCRRYYAPANNTGWDRITVTYQYHGIKYVGQTNVFHIYPEPPRP